MSACFKSKKVVILMGLKGKETRVDVKKVIMDWMHSGISRKTFSEMLKILNQLLLTFVKSFQTGVPKKTHWESAGLQNQAPWFSTSQKGLLKTNRRCSYSNITAKFNEERPEPVSGRTIQQNLQKNIWFYEK